MNALVCQVQIKKQTQKIPHVRISRNFPVIIVPIGWNPSK
jgi:hypothetical protein